MTIAQKIKCNAIIHSFSAAAGGIGFGLANIPCSDSVPLVAIQTAMIISLGTVFGVSVSDAATKTIFADTIGTTIGKGVANVVSGWIPGVGNAVNGVTAAGITETIGWIAAKSFEN